MAAGRGLAGSFEHLAGQGHGLAVRILGVTLKNRRVRRCAGIEGRPCGLGDIHLVRQLDSRRVGNGHGHDVRLGVVGIRVTLAHLRDIGAVYLDRAHNKLHGGTHRIGQTIELPSEFKSNAAGLISTV